MGAESGDEQNVGDWPDRGMVGDFVEMKGRGWERTRSGVGAGAPLATLRTRCRIFVPAFES